jgi:sulfate adenylyltransferase subunit 1
MVTAASSADAAVVLVDATKLDWPTPPGAAAANPPPQPAGAPAARALIVFAVNKLDAVADPALAFEAHPGALKPLPGRGHSGDAPPCPSRRSRAGTWWTPPTRLVRLHRPHACCSCWKAAQHAGRHAPAAGLPGAVGREVLVLSDTSQGRRVFWGRVAAGTCARARRCKSSPAASWPPWPRCWTTPAAPGRAAGHSAGIVLDREVDVSRGDWIAGALGLRAGRPGRRRLSTPPPPPRLARQPRLRTTIAWMDDEPLVAGRVYWALHGHRWVKAKVKRVVHQAGHQHLAEEDATQLEPPTPSAMWSCCCKSHSRCAVCPPRAGIADPGGHRQPQDRGRRAGELTQRIKKPESPLPAGARCGACVGESQ